MANHIDEKLFTDFPPSTREEWVNATVKSLKGKPFEKLIKTTYEGIEIQPMYRADNIEHINQKDTLPGEYPYIRGTKVDGYRAWLIAQEINHSNPQSFNQALKHALERGQSAIYVGEQIRIDSVKDLEAIFAGIDLTKYPLFIHADVNAGTISYLLGMYLQDDITKVKGCIGYDPLHRLAKTGIVSQSWFGGMAHVIGEFLSFDVIAVRTDIYHFAGANVVQELAIAMATGVQYLSEMLVRKLDIDLVAQKMRFFLSIGENFFMEIAKLRAIKMMWAQIVREFGGNETSQKIKLHASTGLRNKTRYDPYVNMLRVTSEAMAGAIGGVDSMTTTPFDVAFGQSDEFSQRIARNVQLILQEEVNLTEVIDPAGGSWYVEALTEQLAHSAWEFFQQIEAQGGMIKAMQSGYIHSQIQSMLDKRLENIANRRDALVGTNMYPILDETLLTDKPVNLPNYAPFDDLVIEATPLQPIRLSEAFELLRNQSEGYRQQNGKRPQIFLVNFGELPQYKARMDFTRGFYEVGGFELIDQGGYDTVDSAVQATIDRGAPAVVICSTDEMYTQVVPEFVRTLKREKPDIVVILAGYPPDKIEEYKQAGVDEFIHLRANCYAMNKDLQDRLGVGR